MQHQRRPAGVRALPFGAKYPQWEVQQSRDGQEHKTRFSLAGQALSGTECADLAFSSSECTTATLVLTHSLAHSLT